MTKKLFDYFFLFAIFMNVVSCFGTENGPKILAAAKGKIIGGDSGEYEVRKISQKDSITLQVFDRSGKTVWKSEELGSKDKKFTFAGKAETLLLKDISKDGIPEIITAAFYGPRASGLYIFSFSDKTKNFEAIRCRFPKDDLVRDFFVSDIFQESGSDLVFEPDETLKTLGMIYPDDPAKLPENCVYSFALQKGEFVHTKTETIGKEN